MAKAPELLAHQQWLGYVQPIGLVVSPPALLAAQAQINNNIIPDHTRFLEWVEEVSIPDSEDTLPAVTDLPGLLRDVFGWESGDLLGSPGAQPLPDSVEVTLTEYNETLRPTYVVKEFEPQDGGPPWLMLVQALPLGTDLDEFTEKDDARWQASPQSRFERLLRESKVPIGLLFNESHFRLAYAPHGETSGHITFPVSAMREVSGRPIFAALHLLLSADRLFSRPRNQRLAAILAESRKYQNLVSTQLSHQVLNSLYELLQGIQAANDHAKGELLREALQKDPDHVYGGLLTVLLRLVFILYAEDRGLLSTDPLYTNHYSVTGLFERLRDDANRYPDTMDQRYGAWAQLLTLFRLVHDGAEHGNLKLPPRRGGLFDPDRYKFLEGRSQRANSEENGKIDPPAVSDGVIYRILNNLLILDGERLSYRTLDVEEIGSVYQTVMGFRLEVVTGPSIAIVGKRKHKGQVPAPTVINLEGLFSIAGKDRSKWLRDRTEQEISGDAEKALIAATTMDDILVALDRKIARHSTPNLVPRDAMVLQPTDERRRSGSHYTPRSFTEPIVRKTLEPILKRLGEHPTPEQILDLKICDMAVGSAAFLVEACRQLGDDLVKAWHHHGERPLLPADETEELLARRLIAQRCLYGVDRNPMAVDLAKLSLWLATLAKDHPFTFLDHAIRCGNSLVGLTRQQIADFHWREEKVRAFGQDVFEKRIDRAAAARKEILEAGDFVLPELKRQKLALADTALELVRLAGDCVIAAFFSGDKDKVRNEERNRLLERFTRFVTKSDVTAAPNAAVETLRSGQFPVIPFHWEIEFPEVFDRDNPGFDAIVGNPPFAGKNTLAASLSHSHLDWFSVLNPKSSGNADLVAHFFRRAFNLLRRDGCFGLIATNTIGQGDTRSTGLRWICTHGGTIFAARKRYKWPGQAAVVVSLVHVIKRNSAPPFELDGRKVTQITAYLFHTGPNENPCQLEENEGKSSPGPIPLSMGFTFDDTNTKGIASPVAEMHRLIAKNSRNAGQLFPYIGGDEILNSPTQAHHRFIINFRDMSESEARQWPDLMAIVEQKVKPSRIQDNREAYRKYWWQFAEKRTDLMHKITTMDRVLVHPFTSSYLSFAFVPSSTVISGPHTVFVFDTFSPFAVLQARVHEVWVRFFASSLEDTLRYTLGDCFCTFPFPRDFDTNAALQRAGQEYYEFRAALMVKNNEGLTKTYNRFHNPEERSSDILRLRELHTAVDRVVLDAYGWIDLMPTCEFLLDYEDEEEDEDEHSGKKKKKKPWRYRWPNEIRDEVLARLLKLNTERAEEEKMSGATVEKKGGKGKTRKATGKSRGRSKKDALTKILFD